MTGNELRELIRRNGLTQEEAATKLNITRRTLQNWFCLPELDANISQNVNQNILTLPQPSSITESVIIPKAVFDQMTRLTETILSQQRTIENLTTK